MSPDLINGTFEVIGGICSWLNVRKYLKDRAVEGIFWPSSFFYTSWGLWNLLYYPAIHQPLSFIGGVFLTAGTMAWLAFVVYDKCKYYLEQHS